MKRATTFETPLGTCGIVWRGNAVTRLELPAASSAAVAERLLSTGADLVDTPARAHGATVRRIQRHLEGSPDPLLDVEVDVEDLSPFAAKVSEAARRVPPGTTETYGELARACGSPNAARAVGGVMARNPVPLIIPCHRVVGANRALTGFSAHGDLSTKLRLLTIEGADLAVLARAGVRYLRSADEQLAVVIRRTGPYRLSGEQRADPFTALVESIVHQQVSMAAGRTIFGRLLDRAGGSNGQIRPEQVLALDDRDLRGVGLSSQKVSYVRDLARRTTDGLPLRAMQRMDDEAVISALTEVRGIGRWSAQMFLMFRLGRLDVLPVDDLGVKKGAQAVYDLPALPSARELTTLAQRWRPYRSIASWYLWRSLDAGGL